MNGKIRNRDSYIVAHPDGWYVIETPSGSLVIRREIQLSQSKLRHNVFAAEILDEVFFGLDIMDKLGFNLNIQDSKTK